MTQRTDLFDDLCCFFLTIRLARPTVVSLVAEVDALRAAYLKMQKHHPVTCHAMVVLPDHLHAVWSMPETATEIGNRVGMLKSRFSRALPDVAPSPGVPKMRDGERGIWLRGYDHHPIPTAEARANAVRWCWNNPVKHGLCARPEDWPYSSLHRDMRKQNASLRALHTPATGRQSRNSATASAAPSNGIATRASPAMA
ncbi:putative transposase [Rubricella aquisinus]|uniref:Putative transposase n=1 Tax=Rubricella aquisinus TaxID=2028108 RepID=A0A840WXD0_9RHOB|nr:transposase [Rubricella aquisinus]MBB5514346.1 putative transposase [Rubricella aquisinus]